MATIKLTPSTYYRSNSNYLSVSNASNMYADTSSTTYATVTNSRTSTTSYYLYIRGFDFDSVPSDAIVSNIAIRLKAYHSGGNTSTIYCYDGTTQVADAGSTTALGTSATVKEFTNVTVDWDTLKGYGSDFGIRINCRRSSRNTTAYVYVYGAEIEVTYTVPVYHSVTVSNSTSATVTVSDSNPLEGTDVEVRASTVTGIQITDNGTDITSQFVQRTDSGASYDVENVGSYGFTLNGSTGYYVSNNNGISKSAAVARVDFYVPVAATVTFTYINYAEQGYDFGVFGNIDVALSNNYYAAGSNGATITDSSYKRACNTSTYNTSGTQTLTYDMPSGSHSIWIKYSKDDASDSGNDTLQFKVAITLNEPFTPGTYWGYDISNITADHAIVVAASGSGPEMYVKLNGTWTNVTRAYRKVSGSWQQIDLDQAFTSGTNYVKGTL